MGYLTVIFMFSIANVSLVPLQRVVARRDIECPGDIFPYNCSILSNSETLHLIWRITLPGETPVDISYYNGTFFDDTAGLNGFLTSSLTEYTSNEYIESILEITVQANSSTDQLMLQCLIEGLGNDSSYVLINSSSKTLLIARYNGD